MTALGRLSATSRRSLLGAALVAPFLPGRQVRAADESMSMPMPATGCESATAALSAPAVTGRPRKLTIAWNETAICTAAVPVAKAKGFFARYGLDIDYVDFAGSTDQLLEALSTGKADGAPGMALRWLKPLSQGFDVKLVAGLHAGCMHLLGAHGGAVQLADLRGKAVGVTDIGGPDKNFFSIRFKEIGIDPERDIDWRQYPADLLPVALRRGAVQAISGGDPLSYLQKRQFDLIEIDSNMRGAWGGVTCCVVGLSGPLIRNDPDIAARATRAILDAGAWVGCNPDETGRIFQPYAPKATAADLAAMLRLHNHHHQTVGPAFRAEIARYADALRDVGVFSPTLDSGRYASKVTQDLFQV